MTLNEGGEARFAIVVVLLHKGAPVNWPIDRSDELSCFAACPHSILYSVDLWKIQTMMQTCASTAKLRGGGPFLTIGWKAMELSGITATSDRYRRSVNRVTAEIYA